MRQRNETERRTNNEVCHAINEISQQWPWWYVISRSLAFKTLAGSKVVKPVSKKRASGNLLFHRPTIEYRRKSTHPNPNPHAHTRVAIQGMGCITSRPLPTRRPKTTVKSISPLNIKETSRRLAHLRDFCSRLLRSCIPYRPSSRKTADAPPKSPEPDGNTLWGEQIDRYEEAMAEMSLPKGERLRKQSAPESCRSGGSRRMSGADRDGENSF